MDHATIARWRLHRQAVSSPAATAQAALEHLGAAQGQEVLPALWALSQRSAERPTLSDLERLYDDGAILRTHVLRPTWHFVNPADLRWLLTATSPRVHQANAYQDRRNGVDEPTMHAVRRVLESVLPGTALTRTDLQRHLAEAGLEAAGVRLACMVMWAELEGWIVSGPRQGRQHTYALLDERAPTAVDLDRPEALVELARRYVTSRGPATTKDFATWASLTQKEALPALQASGADQVVVAGRTYWIVGEAPPPADERVDLVYTLDELVMSYSESREVLTGAFTGSVPAETWDHPVLRDGRVVGLWRYDKGRRVESDVVGAPLEEWDRFTGASSAPS